MQIFAHRGYSGVYPENTMLAFREAHATGCGAIELDCHLTADGEIVIIHDELLDRTTNMSGPVGLHTLEQLQTANAAINAEGDHPFQAIPTFEEYCEWVSGTELLTNVEIKTDFVPYPNIEEKIWETVSRHHLEDRVLFSCFNHLSLRVMHDLAPEAPLGALVWEQGGARAFLADYCTRHGFTAWHPSASLVTPDIVAECHAAGIEINVWTIDDVETFERMYEMGVDGIITDYPEAALQWLARLESDNA